MAGTQPRRASPSGHRHAHVRFQDPRPTCPGAQSRQPPTPSHRHAHVRFEDPPLTSRNKENDSRRPVKMQRDLRCKTCGDIYGNDWECKCGPGWRKQQTKAKARNAYEIARELAEDVKEEEKQRRRHIKEEKKRKNAEWQRAQEKAEHRGRSPNEGSRAKRASSNRPMQNYYTILGVSPSCTHEEIIKAAKKKRIESHPDRFSGQILGISDVDVIVERSKMVGHAADILCDPTARQKYNSKLAAETIWGPRQRERAEGPSQRETTEGRRRRGTTEGHHRRETAERPSPRETPDRNKQRATAEGSGRRGTTEGTRQQKDVDGQGQRRTAEQERHRETIRETTEKVWRRDGTMFGVFEYSFRSRPYHRSSF